MNLPPVIIRVIVAKIGKTEHNNEATEVKLLRCVGCRRICAGFKAGLAPRPHCTRMNPAAVRLRLLIFCVCACVCVCVCDSGCNYRRTSSGDHRYSYLYSYAACIVMLSGI